MAITTAAEVADLAGALPAGIAPERGEELYRFVREHRPRTCLELGVGHGVSALYIGAALEANGVGTLTTVDRRSAQGRKPAARDVIEQAGLGARVDVAYEETSYTWFLHDALRAQLAAGGRIEPRYDFVFIDGAHAWDVDSLAFSLTDRLLRPGGWILFDDLGWKLDERWPSVPPRQRALAQVSEIWDLLVVTHPDYDEFRSDGQWGWAHKSPTAPAASRLLVRRELVSATFALVRASRASPSGAPAGIASTLWRSGTRVVAWSDGQRRAARRLPGSPRHRRRARLVRRLARRQHRRPPTAHRPHRRLVLPARRVRARRPRPRPR